MTNSSDEVTSEVVVSVQPDYPRRGIVRQAITAVLSFLLVAVPGTLGGLFFLDPILRRKKSGGNSDSGAVQARKDSEGYIRLDVTRDAIPADGTPVSVTVFDDIDDAWNRFSNVPVGSIWLRRGTDGVVSAFNSICPHLGCSVNFRRAENDFFCPCHTSAFGLDGEKTNQIPPRGMDSLDVSLRTAGETDSNGSEVWVRFCNFRRATAEKIEIQ